METFRSEHFCMRVRIFGNDRRNDYAFAFCDETIYRKKAQVNFFSGAFLPCGRPGYPHFAVFAAHSFTSFRNCSAGATIPNVLSKNICFSYKKHFRLPPIKFFYSWRLQNYSAFIAKNFNFCTYRRAFVYGSKIANLSSNTLAPGFSGIATGRQKRS